MYQSLSPNLMVEDVSQTLEFYTSVLQAQVLVTVPEQAPLNWAMLQMGDVQLMFQTRTSFTEEMPVLRDCAIGGSLSLYIKVGDVEALYEQIRAKAKVVVEPHTTFYGAREFAIQDNNGYILVFSQMVE